MRTYGLTVLASWLAWIGGAQAADPVPPAAPAGSVSSCVIRHGSIDQADECICWEDRACGSRWWFQAEYLLWWIEDHPLPVPVLSTGGLNIPGSLIILGGNNVVAEERHGGRFTLGGWINEDQTFGVEGNYFFLGRRSDNQSAFSSGLAGSPVQGVPFLLASTIPPTESFFALAVPGIAANLTSVAFSSFLEGTELNVIGNLVLRERGRVDLLAGFRYLNLDEKLNVLHSSPGVVPGIADFIILDRFDTRNQFYGGQLGLRAQVQRGRLFANLTTKIALGSVNEEANINGLFLLNNALLFRGIFTWPSNIGQHNRSEFAWMHELTLNVGVELRSNIRAFVGYNFLWISDVLRPGNQIDRAVNLTQPAFGPALPAPRLVDTSFWAQGLNFGVQLQF